MGNCNHFSFSVSTSDYIAKTTVLTFAPCQVVQCLTVSLRDDCVLEKLETFNITLTLPPVERRIRLDSGNGIISITDNDGKCNTVTRHVIQIFYRCGGWF